MRLWAVALVVAACSPDFRMVGNGSVPLELDLSTGVPRTEVHQDSAVVPAVLDTGSPLSVLSNSAGCRDDSFLALGDGAAPDRLRLVFPDFHPYCVDGPPVVGGDLLAHYEVIFAGDRCSSTLGCVQFLAGEIEPTRDLSELDGFAVLSFPLAGGGTLLDAQGRVRTFPATRVTLRACVNPPANYDPKNRDLGKDVTLMIATGVQPSLVLGTAARDRVGLAKLGAALPIELPGAPMPVAATAATPIDRLALVGQTLSSSLQDPGACAELQRARCLANNTPALRANPLLCDELVLTDPDSIDNTSDSEAYVIFEGPLPVSVIGDDVPYLQGARDDVRPRLADVDGFIGAELLSRVAELRIDYLGVPSDDVDGGPRVMMRCTLRGCVAVPRWPKVTSGP